MAAIFPLDELPPCNAPPLVRERSSTPPPGGSDEKEDDFNILPANPPRIVRQRSLSADHFDRVKKKTKKSSRTKRSETVQVACRIRPENDWELKQGGEFAVEFSNTDDSIVGLNKNGKLYHFRYSKVFQQYATQEEVYDYVGHPVIEDICSGYNACILAYGQTGSGKTHTMFGPSYPEDTQINIRKALMEPGIIPRVLAALFDRIRTLESNTNTFNVRASYIEIYMERVKDLLSPEPVPPTDSLKMRSDNERGLWLPDATEVPVYRVSQAMTMIETGAKRRVTGATKSNLHSSRSHAIFIVTVTKFNSETSIRQVSQLYLVDLAGSEKVSKTGTHGLRLDEAKKINQSLLALSQVIFALASNKKVSTSHIPYRDSKLTRLLQNSLGGNARTSLIICASPSSINDGETLSTLRFGDRTKKITNCPTVNRELSAIELKNLLKLQQFENRKLLGTIQQLKDEIRVMKEIERLSGIQNNYQQTFHPRSPTPGQSPSPIEDKNPYSTLELVESGKQSMKQMSNIKELYLHFSCPLSRCIMYDPVLAMDGYSYERERIQVYLKAHDKSPVTELVACSEVSEEWATLANEDHLWRILYVKHFDHLNPDPGGQTMKAFFSEKAVLRARKNEPKKVAMKVRPQKGVHLFPK